MNLVSGLEEDPNAFRWAVYAGTGSMAVIMAVGWIRMVRNRRSQLFLRSYARARPQTTAIQSRSLKIPAVEELQMAPRPDEKRVGSEVEKEGAKKMVAEETEQKEKEAAKAQEAEEKKEASKDGSNL